MKTLKKLEQEIFKAQSIIREVMSGLGSLDYKMGPFGIEISTSYFDDTHDEFEKIATKLVDKLVYEMKDYDHPINIDSMKRFCAFMEFSVEDTEKLLSVCPSEKQYDEWQQEEQQRYAF